MTEHDEALDRFLDSLMQGSNPDEPDLDRGSAEAARRLVRAGSGPLPGPAFVNQLESLLVERSKPGTASGASSRNAGFGIALRANEPRWRPHPVLATAAILALVLVSMFSVLRFGDSSSGGNATIAGVFQAASASAHSDLASTPEMDTATPEAAFATVDSQGNPCSSPNVPSQVLENLRKQFPLLLYSVIPGSQRPAIDQSQVVVTVISQSDLPEGTAIDPALKNSLLAALDVQVACRNTGGGGWSALLARFNHSTSPVADATPTIVPMTAPDVLSFTQLPDGRVGLLLANDLYGAGLKSYLLLIPYDGAWLFDGYALIGSDDWIMSSYQGLLDDSIQIDLFDVYFSPPELEIPANEPVTVVVTNHGDNPHTFTIERLDVSLTLQPGQSETLTLIADAGSYPFLTDLPNNGDWSVAGIIWAIDRSNTATPAS